MKKDKEKSGYIEKISATNTIYNISFFAQKSIVFCPLTQIFIVKGDWKHGKLVWI